MLSSGFVPAEQAKLIRQHLLKCAYDDRVFFVCSVPFHENGSEYSKDQDLQVSIFAPDEALWPLFSELIKRPAIQNLLLKIMEEMNKNQC